MGIRQVNIISQYELVSAYVEKYGGEWNDACDIVSNWDDGDRDYYLADIYDNEEADEVSLLELFLKEIMEENDIDEIYVSRE